MLTFDELHRVNAQRCRRWHPGFLSDNDEDEWTGADWSNALGGEGGELAEVLADLMDAVLRFHASLGQVQNTVKKMRRVETGTTPGPDDPPYEDLRAKLRWELADVIGYADLLASFYGIDLGDATAEKFNEVSRRQGFPDRLPRKKDKIEITILFCTTCGGKSGDHHPGCPVIRGDQ